MRDQKILFLILKSSIYIKDSYEICKKYNCNYQHRFLNLGRQGTQNIKIESDKVNPIREKNIENLSKIQRLNLELKSLDKENERIKIEIENIKKSLKTIEEDTDREKSIVIDATSNEKRLKEEKKELIDIDAKYDSQQTYENRYQHNE